MNFIYFKKPLKTEQLWSQEDFQLLVVRQNEFPQVPMATVSQVNADQNWKLQMGSIQEAELEDGFITGQGFKMFT